jgi:hypothetical protein
MKTVLPEELEMKKVLAERLPEDRPPTEKRLRGERWVKKLNSETFKETG